MAQTGPFKLETEGKLGTLQAILILNYPKCGKKSRFTGRRERSLPRRWLPELNLVAFRVHDPSKLPVLRVVCLFKHVAAFFA